LLVALNTSLFKKVIEIKFPFMKSVLKVTAAIFQTPVRYAAIFKNSNAVAAF